MILVVILFIFSPFLIDSVYKKRGYHPSLLYKNSLLAIFSLILVPSFSFAGTVILSILALRQNKKIDDNNNKFQEKQEELFKELLKIQKNIKRPLLVLKKDKIVDLEFKKDPNNPEYVKADFSYEFKLMDGGWVWLYCPSYRWLFF